MRKLFLPSLAVLFLAPFAVQAAVSAPSDLSASPISACAVRLNWTASLTAGVNYNSYYTTDGDFSIPGHIYPVGTTAALSIEHESIPPNSGADYRYRLRAFNPLNPSDFSTAIPSAPATVRTNPLAAPGNPTGLLVNGKSGGEQAELTWTSPALSTYGGFEVWRSENGTNFTKVGSGTSLLSGGYTDGTPGSDLLDPTQIYFYKVRNFESDYGCATGDELLSGFSDIVKVPAHPTNLSVSYQFRPTSQIDLSWTAGDGQNYYEVWRAKNEETSEKIGAPFTSSFSDTSLESNQKYSYKARGCATGGGCSSFLESATVTVADAPQNPAIHIYYVEGIVGNVRVSWDDTFPSGDYVIKRATDGGSFSDVETVSGSSSNIEDGRVMWRDKNLALGHIYTYKIYSDFGGGSPSNDSVPVAANLNMDKVLSGQAWANTGAGQGVGWVSLNSASETPARSGEPHYSVQVDRDGLFSGEAWTAIDGNENYGWLSFNKSDLENCPAGYGPCEARLSSVTNEISGWARFIAPKKTGSGNWDGWVSLRGTSWGVLYNPGTQKFEGTAWGGDIVGWLAFSKTECGGKCAVGGATLSQPPVVTNVRIERNPDAWCSPNPSYRIAWTYTDPNTIPQAQQSAEIKIIGSATFTRTMTSESTTYIQNQEFGFTGPLGALSPNTDFSVSVRASNGTLSSNWTDSSNSTTTPSHYYPLVDFNWTPTSNISVGSVMTFTDATTRHPVASRSWMFTGGNNLGNAGDAETKVVMTASPLDAALLVTDSDGNSCSMEATISGDGSGTSQKRRIFIEK